MNASCLRVKTRLDLQTSQSDIQLVPMKLKTCQRFHDDTLFDNIEDVTRTKVFQSLIRSLGELLVFATLKICK